MIKNIVVLFSFMVIWNIARTISIEFILALEAAIRTAADDILKIFFFFFFKENMTLHMSCLPSFRSYFL